MRYWILGLLPIFLSANLSSPYYETTETSDSNFVEAYGEIFSRIAKEGHLCSPSDQYTLIDKLGQGFFGRVDSVINSSGDSFAIKSYLRSSPPDKKKTFGMDDPQREFERGMLLNHPNIIKTFEIFSHEWSPNQFITHIVLELVRGKTLSQIERSSRPKERALSDMIQLYSALRYALGLNFLYLDLHGGNIMLDEEDRIKIIDLASFFTPDETERAYNSYFSEISIPMTTKFFAYKGPSPEKEGKFAKILQKNPEIIKVLQKNGVKKGNNLAKMASLPTASSSTEFDFMSKELSSCLSLQHYYLCRMHVSCLQYLYFKSDIPRGQLETIRATLQSFNEEYLFDKTAGKELPLHAYFDQLISYLHSLLE